MSPLRIGVLGCASVVDYAMVNPLRDDPVLTVAAVASRSGEKAGRFAAERAIECAYGSYADLLTDPDLDAVYIALPNSLHHEWSIAAFR